MYVNKYPDTVQAGHHLSVCVSDLHVVCVSHHTHLLSPAPHVHTNQRAPQRYVKYWETSMELKI